MSLIILTAADVDQVVQKLDLSLAVKGQASVFAAYSTSAGDSSAIQTPHRLTIQSDAATSLFMPARVEGQGTAIKIVSNPKKGGSGLPASTLVLDDEGRVRAMVNARKLTALRNACGSALFLQLCPPPQPPRHLMIFGSGAQAHSHASVFSRLFPSIEKITLAVRSRNTRATDLQSTLKHEFPKNQVDLIVTHDNGSRVDLGDTIKSADVIVTVTSSTEPLFPWAHVSPDTRLILVGSYTPKMKEVDDDLIKRGGILVVDSKKACGTEAGELLSAGITDDDTVELGTLVDDQAARGRVGDGGDVVIFKSVGLGIQDVAITKLVFDSAVSSGLGTEVSPYDA